MKLNLYQEFMINILDNFIRKISEIYEDTECQTCVDDYLKSFFNSILVNGEKEEFVNITDFEVKFKSNRVSRLMLMSGRWISALLPEPILTTQEMFHNGLFELNEITPELEEWIRQII